MLLNLKPFLSLICLLLLAFLVNHFIVREFGGGSRIRDYGTYGVVSIKVSRNTQSYNRLLLSFITIVPCLLRTVNVLPDEFIYSESDYLNNDNDSPSSVYSDLCYLRQIASPITRLVTASCYSIDCAS